MVKSLVQDIFFKAMQQLAINPHNKIAVAVSGGSDSLALTLLANAWAKARIIAITVDHGLRKESEYEAAQVARWLAKYDIEHYTLKWKGDKQPSNIQANARNARYELMTDFCKQQQIANLLVAHTKEDQAETVLIRLMRGSGLEGLCGIRNKVTINDIRIIRPLLDTKKEDLKSYLRSQKQGWIEDPSNQNDKFARVRVRKFINSSDEPELLISRLASTANALQRSNDYIQQNILREISEVADIKSEGYCLLDIEKFKALHVEVGLKIMAKLIKSIGGQYYKPRFEKLENLYNFIQNGEYNATLGGCEIYQSKKQSEAGKLLIIRENSAIQDDLEILSGSSVIWDGRFKCSLKYIEENFIVGAFSSSDLLSIARERQEFKNLKLPKRVIFALPALKTLENIVAVPHIGYYKDKKFEDSFKAEFVF